MVPWHDANGAGTTKQAGPKTMPKATSGVPGTRARAVVRNHHDEADRTARQAGVLVCRANPWQCAAGQCAAGQCAAGQCAAGQCAAEEATVGPLTLRLLEAVL